MDTKIRIGEYVRCIISSNPVALDEVVKVKHILDTGEITYLVLEGYPGHMFNINNFEYYDYYNTPYTNGSYPKRPDVYMREDPKEIKIKEITKHMEAIMDIMGMKRTANNMDTPKRVAKMYVNDIFPNVNNETIEELNSKMTCFPLDFHKRGNKDLIIVEDIPFYSTCEHHFMPFFGKITIGYVPNEKIIGLSKLPRVVKYFSKKPQLQERLVSEIADYLMDILDCEALFVLGMDCVHTCVSARGIETVCTTNTLETRGIAVEEHRDSFYKRIRR